MHVDSWWDSYLEHGGTPKTSVYIYIYSDVHTIRTSGLESFYYMNIQCRTTTTYDSNIRFGKFLLYEYIVPDNYNIQNILYIHRIFQNARRQLVGFLLRTWRNPQNLCIYIQRCTYDSNIRFGKFLLYEYSAGQLQYSKYIIYTQDFPKCTQIAGGILTQNMEEPPKPLCIYIYSDVHTIRTSGLESFYYMNIQCRTTTIFKIYYIYTGFSKMHVDSWWDSYLEHGGTPKTSVYIYIQRCTYDSNIRFGKFLLYEYIVPDNYNIQNILYIHRIFQNARRQLVGFLLRTWRNPQNLCIYIYIQRCTYDSNIRFGKFLLYEYIVPDNYNIQNILYIYTGFSKMHVDSWWDSYLEHGGTPKTSVYIYIYIAMYIRFEHQVWKVFII